MSQDDQVGPLEDAVGYVLKQAAAALRAEMDAVLRPLGLTVPQYACLELLGQRPGLSNADLARGAFVTRQSMNGVLRGLQDRGLVTRPPTAPHGRARPTELTATGRELQGAASRAVRRVEQRMLARLSGDGRDRLRRDLASCVDALTGTAPPIGPP
jgi:DNA-binding MarR family transcriptional regulator